MIFNHNGIVREWEWAPSTPIWLPREEWTCVRCRTEFTRPPRNVPQYAMDRPNIDMSPYTDIYLNDLQMRVHKALPVGTVRMRVYSLDTLHPIRYDVIHHEENNTD